MKIEKYGFRQPIVVDAEGMIILPGSCDSLEPPREEDRHSWPKDTVYRAECPYLPDRSRAASCGNSRYLTMPSRQ